MLPFPPRKPIFAAVLLLLLAVSAGAHDPFESTAVARLQHGRLEVVLTMTTQLAAVLADPAAPALNAATLPGHRERLEAGARRLYEVTAGGTPLAPLRLSTRLAEGGHIEIALLYPRPPAGPLRFRSRPFAGLPGSYSADLEIRDEEEKLLGRKFITPQNIASAELSIAAAALPLAEGAPGWMAPAAPTAPAVAPARATPAPGPRWPWFALGTAGALLVFAVGLAWLLGPKPRNTAH